jgi:hypothetical protein
MNLVSEVMPLSTLYHWRQFALPRLIVADSASPPEVLPDDSESDIEVWREHDATVCAYGYSARGAYWLYFPRLANYRFTATDDVIAFAYPTARQGWIDDTYYRSVLPLVLQVRGSEVLHASAVLTEQGVVAFCATSETGKSTIAYGLSRRGYPIWSDDAVVLDSSKPGVSTIPLPFQVRLRPNSATFFGQQQNLPDALGDGYNVNDSPHTQPAPLAILWTLKQMPSSSARDTLTIRRLTPVQAYASMLPHAYCFSIQNQERKRQMLQTYLDLVIKVPIFELCFQTGIERLPSVLDCIEQVVAAQSPANVNSGSPM